LTRSFFDFCLDLAKSPDLPHTFIGHSNVVDITQDTSARCLKMTLAHRQDQCKTVVLAVGTVDRPVIPLFLNKVSDWRLWNHPDPVPTHKSDILHKKISARLGWWEGVDSSSGCPSGTFRLRKEKEESETPHVILLSTRPLAEKHCGINGKWFDMRKINERMSAFFHHPMEER
jgi:hypothetical protein